MAHPEVAIEIEIASTYGANPIFHKKHRQTAISTDIPQSSIHCSNVGRSGVFVVDGDTALSERAPQPYTPPSFRSDKLTRK